MRIASPQKIFTDRKRKKLVTQILPLRNHGFSYAEIKDVLNRKEVYSMTDQKWTKYTMATFINRYVLPLLKKKG